MVKSPILLICITLLSLLCVIFLYPPSVFLCVSPPREIIFSAKEELREKAAAQEHYAGKTKGKIYIVKKGDTLYSLSKRFGVTISELASVNNINNINLIYINQALIVPGPEQKPKLQPPNGQIKQKNGETIRVINPPVRTTSIEQKPKSIEGEGVLLMPWKEVKKLLKPKMTYTLIDVDTNLMFNVVHRFGTLHSDVEPRTPKDTEILKRIYGEWSWERRAVVAIINGKKIAASLIGMPHGSQSITDNNFPGMICVHFLGSAVHKTGKVDPQHQAMVKKASFYELPPDK